MCMLIRPEIKKKKKKFVIFEFLVRDGLDKMGGVTREAKLKMTNKRKVTISCNGKKKKKA